MSADGIWSLWGDPSDGIDLAGSITGMVRDTQPLPVSNATVALFSTDEDLSEYDPENMTNPVPLFTVQTDSDGIFLFPNVTIGEKAYKIVVSKNQRYAVKESSDGNGWRKVRYRDYNAGNRLQRYWNHQRLCFRRK
jgi:hypothetical protein